MAIFNQFTTGALKFRGQLPGIGRQAGAAVGIDIGSASVKAVALDLSRTPIRLLNYAVVDLDDGADRNTRTRVALRTAARRLRRRPAVVAAAIPTAEAIARRISVPAHLKDGALAAHVALSLEDQLHQPPDELHYDFRALGPSPEDSSRLDLLLVACRREVVEARRAALRRARIRCDVVDVEDRAMARTLALTGAASPSANSGNVEAVIDVGHRRIGLHVFDQGEPMHAQNQPMEPDSDPADVAERALDRYEGSPDARQPDHVWLMGGDIGRDGNDLMKSLDAMPVDLKTLTGLEVPPHLQTAALAGRCRRLAVAIGLALHAGDPHAHWR